MTSERNDQEELLKKLAVKEAALGQALNQQKTILDNIPYLVWLKDKDGRYLIVNRAFCEMFDIKPEDVIGRRDLDFCPRDLAEKYLADDQEVIASKKPKYFEEETQNFDGQRVWVETVKNVVLNDKGEVTGTTGVARDITDSKQAEKALLSSEQRLRSIVQTATEAIIVADFAGNVMMWNDAAELMFGYSADDMIGQSMTLVMSKDFANIFLTDLPIVIETGKSQYLGRPFEASGRKRNGSEFPVDVTTSVWKVGEETFMTCLIRDVSERKEAEEEMLEFTSYLDKIINSIADPIFVKDEQHRWVLINNALCEFMGHRLEELIGKSDFDFFPKEQAEVFWEKDDQVFRNGKENINEEKFTDAHGLIHDIVTKKTLYTDKRGRKYLVGIIRDVTGSTHAEESLKESYEKLQRTLIGTADALATALEKRDPYTAGHEKRVAKVACAIAAELGFSQDQINGIRITSFLHDIGKIVVPAEILSKPSKLNEYEYSIVKTHPEVGYDILKGLEFPWPVAKIVLQHHERLNGSGYPNGLTGDTMLREAKILAVSDVVEAMVSHRPYRAAKTVDEALQEITQNKGILYDPEVVNACVIIFREKHFTFDEKPKNEK